MGLLHSIFGINSTAKKVTELLQKGAIIHNSVLPKWYAKQKSFFYIKEKKNGLYERWKLAKYKGTGSEIILNCNCIKVPKALHPLYQIMFLCFFRKFHKVFYFHFTH